jgi:hypothetical protein
MAIGKRPLDELPSYSTFDLATIFLSFKVTDLLMSRLLILSLKVETL